MVTPMSASPGLELARTFADIAVDISSQCTVASTKQRIIEQAKKAFDCDLVVVWRVDQTGHAKQDICTDPDVGQIIERIAESTGEGPVQQCLAERSKQWTRSLDGEMRWPRYCRQMMSHTRLHSSVSYPLEVRDDLMGVLALYARRSEYFSSAAVDAGEVFASHCSVTLDAALTSDRAINLDKALESNRRIGIAIGILMSRLRIRAEDGFQLLRTASQRSHRKLAEVAEDVILTGATPSWPEPTDPDRRHRTHRAGRKR
jgi:transcriptional regulator with GAF, ATPase, and Fis domain